MERETVLSAAAIAEIERLTKAASPNEAEVVVIDNVAYSTQPLHDLRKPPKVPDTLECSTLSGLVDLSKVTASWATERGLCVCVRVVDPVTVELMTDPLPGPFPVRAILARARAVTSDFRFGAWYPADAFIVSLLSQFEPDEDRSRIFEIVGTVESGAAITVADDGVSQMVTVKRGVQRVQVQSGPGDLRFLRPFRTFGEIQQPRSPFLLRMKQGEAATSAPHACALIEADGGRWRIEATTGIRKWLEAALSGACPVVA